MEAKTNEEILAIIKERCFADNYSQDQIYLSIWNCCQSELLPILFQSEKDKAKLTEKILLVESKLNKVKELADHQIPFYAYGDNEAACAMSAVLDNILKEI